MFSYRTIVWMTLSVFVTLSKAHAHTPGNFTEVHFPNRGIVITLLVKFEAFSPRGLKITVSNFTGLDLVSFHGKINLPIRKKEQGALTWETIHPKPPEIIREFSEPEILVGDMINYWMRIQYDGIPLQSESIDHIFKELTPAPDTQPTTPSPVHAAKVGSASSVQKVQTHSIPSIKEPGQEKEEMYCDCPSSAEQTVKMNTEKIGTLEDSILQLQNKISSLSEIVGELVSNMNIGTSLLLTGSLPIRTNPTEDVRQLIVDKLGLPDLSTSIVQAEYKKNGIEFEVSSSIDKLRILKKAKEVLAKAPYQIINADNPPFDIRMAK